MLKRLDLGLTEEALELADMADRSATRLAVLVEDLLVAAGLGDDGSSGSRSPFNVAAEVRAVLGDCRPEHHRIRTSIPQTLIALGDPARSRVVLTHLLSNAEKFSPRGSAISVDVSIADGSVDLVIGDEGPGIPRAYRQKVFERFFQIDGSATRSQGGAGLGLYVAKELAESMGGSLSIDEVPRGASLRFRLPALEGAVAPARSA
jgi:signal transduction histidine kinase